MPFSREPVKDAPPDEKPAITFNTKQLFVAKLQLQIVVYERENL